MPKIGETDTHYIYQYGNVKTLRLKGKKPPGRPPKGNVDTDINKLKKVVLEHQTTDIKEIAGRLDLSEYITKKIIIEDYLKNLLD